MKEMEVCSGRKALFATENATNTIFFFYSRKVALSEIVTLCYSLLEVNSRTYGIALRGVKTCEYSTDIDISTADSC